MMGVDESVQTMEKSTVATDDHVVGKRFIFKCVRFIAGPLTVALLILLGCSGWSIWRYGNVTDGIAFMNGFVLIAEKPTLELGRVAVGDKVEGIFVLKNLTGRPITILGAKPECSCVATSELPIQVEAFSSVHFKLQFTPGKGEASQSVVHHALLYTNIDSPEVTLTIKADILPASTRSKNSKVAKSSVSSDMLGVFLH
jgi:hypothetical protein